VKVRAGDLVPHELNPRRHSEEQREALAALYEEIGFARSVLGYRQADGRLKLIDGHLRQSMDPDMELEVEVLDVNDEEARKLLLSLDPLAQLADYDHRCLQELQSSTQSTSNTLNALWAGVRARDAAVVRQVHEQVDKARQSIQASYHVLIECATEAEQVELLDRLAREASSARR
jgi:hypothetical protein